jgi:hypothetical protein
VGVHSLEFFFVLMSTVHCSAIRRMLAYVNEESVLRPSIVSVSPAWRDVRVFSNLFLSYTPESVLDIT